MNDATQHADTLMEDIHAAAQRLHGVINHTPLLEFRCLNERLRGRVLLKPENLQRMGSFKIRGAYNALACLSEQARARGVVAWSSGNHAQGVALAAHLFGVPATIVMPHDAPAGKTAAVRALGARIVCYDRYREDREAIARQIATAQGLPLIPSYDHLPVIAGQGTVGLELVHDPALAGTLPSQVLVCCGGGGLTAGIATVMKERSPATHLYAVEPDKADDTRRSLRAGERLRNPRDAKSICDALLTPVPGELTFPINATALTDVLTVSDEDVLYAIGYARHELRLVVEPGGVVCLAALLAGKLDAAAKTTILTLSGGNIDDHMLDRALAHYSACQNDSV
ncbi:MAG: threonine/serine dehydratase [Pseudomonadota bacterium]